MEAAGELTDTKMEQLKKDTNDELEALSERVFTQLTPKLNALAAQAQLDSRASQCHGTPTCNDAGECTAAKKEDGIQCDDYDADTTDDVCNGGKCAGKKGGSTRGIRTITQNPKAILCVRCHILRLTCILPLHISFYLHLPLFTSSLSSLFKFRSF